MHVPQTVKRSYRVVSNADITEQVFELTLEPMTPDDRIPAFEAGQWVNLHLLNKDGSVWAASPYSIAIAPAEAEPDLPAGRQGGRVVLAIKRAGDFTARAHDLNLGDTVFLQGPFGAFTLKHASRSVFFAGGIGITPIRSMVRHALAAYPDMDMIVFYSVRDASQCAYEQEFRDMDARLNTFRLITQPPCVEDPRSAEVYGGVDAALLDQAILDYGRTEYYLCGPKAFMDKIIAFLHTRGVYSNHIHQERFS